MLPHSLFFGSAFTALSVHGNKMAAAVPDITSAFEVREGKVGRASYNFIKPLFSEKQKIDSLVMLITPPSA